MTTPLLLTPEWARHASLWVGWPRLADEWAGGIELARDEIADFIRAAARFEPIKVAIGDEAAAAAARTRGLHEVATLVPVPTGDIWLRDTGPLFSVDGGSLQALSPQFNGWGGKYDMPGDEETGAAIARSEDASLHEAALVLEGGAIDFDGTTLLTTDECLLNRNRNGFDDRHAAESALRALFTFDRVVWLRQGLLNDHTDGHIDNAARFVAPNLVVCQSPAGPEDPHRDRFEAIETDLREAGLTVSTIPGPGRVGDALPASHLNFVILNDAVLVPTYGTATAEAALDGLRPLFPGRAVIGLSALAILTGGGGAFHCMTRDIPALQET